MKLHDNDEARRAFWTRRMDEAHAFMMTMRDYPVKECGEPMLPLIEAARAAGIELAASAKLYLQRLPRLYYLRAGLVPPFLAVAREMNERGWILTLEDGYRTTEMQQSNARREEIFDAILRSVQWECRSATPPLDLLYRRFGALIANAPKVGTHMSGTAMDVSVLNRDTGEEVDRGAPYLEMSELTPMDSPFVSAAAQRNRREITDLMRRQGFVAYHFEFWHYNAGDAYAEYLNHTGQPARYGAVSLDPATGRVTPIADPNKPLNPPEAIQELMERALARLAP
jgi:D-alanyl-D-alanine dipeptidase